MAYERYVPEFTDKNGQVYGVMDAEAREEVSELNSAINEDRLLFVSEIEDTVQTLTRDSSGAVTGMIHSRDGNVVRTDTYVKANGIFTETRTLANGKYITLVTDLSTKVTTISDVQEAA